jgi:chromate transport protein ChrA
VSSVRAQLAVFRVLFKAGATTFGGMWAATDKLERDLVDRAGWISKEELRASFVLATLIPSPRFLGLGGLVGFRVGGWLGSLLGALGPMTRAVSIAIVGVLFANAYRQVRSEKGSRRHGQVGVALSAAILAAVVLGVPLIVVAVAGFVLGALLLRPEPKGGEG